MTTAQTTAVCTDTVDVKEFYLPAGLYLKPVARVTVTVSMPSLKTPGQTISNWEVMEKVKSMIKPNVFVYFKAIKTTLEYVRCEGELDNLHIQKTVLNLLDGKLLKLSGFMEELKVSAAEARVPFPTRHDWDSFFRDAIDMDEMKPGERPDTLHIDGLPIKWFVDRKGHRKEKPSEELLRKCFEQFGEIRTTDVPCLDPYRSESRDGNIQTFSFNRDVTFSAYVQFKEYVSFALAMDALRGMKLVYKDDEGKPWSAAIKVDFDKTRHLSDRAIRKRRTEREKLERLEREREERIRREREAEENRLAEERRKKEAEEAIKERKRQEREAIREMRKKEREEKRRLAQLEKKQKLDEERMHQRILLEERKILIAHRKLESIRLLTVLLDRIRAVKEQDELMKREKELEEERLRQMEETRKRKLAEEDRRIKQELKKRQKLNKQESELKDKILRRVKQLETEREENDRERLRHQISKSKKRLKSTVAS